MATASSLLVIPDHPYPIYSFGKMLTRKFTKRKIASQFIHSCLGSLFNYKHSVLQIYTYYLLRRVNNEVSNTNIWHTRQYTSTINDIMRIKYCYELCKSAFPSRCIQSNSGTTTQRTNKNHYELSQREKLRQKKKKINKNSIGI